jgi:hypothetical protein
MSEKKEGFFSQIKNQIITTLGVVITAAGGIVVTNMESIFTPEEKIQEVQPIMEQSIIVPKETKDTVVVSKTIVISPKIKKKKTETEKRKEEGLNW